MAYQHRSYCHVCEKDYMEINNQGCPDCKEKEEKLKKEKWLKELRENKTIEERIEQLEELMYKQCNHKHFSIYHKVF